MLTFAVAAQEKPKRSIDDPNVYWCVVCGKGIERAPDGRFYHTEGLDHSMMTYTEEDNPQ